MIRRLVEQSYYSTAEPSPQSIEFWLAELRSPELLIDVAERYRQRRRGTLVQPSKPPSAGIEPQSRINRRPRRERSAQPTGSIGIP